MKAAVAELWDTGDEILVYDGTDEAITTFRELAQCENALVGEPVGGGWRKVVIDGSMVTAKSRKVQHPSGGGSLIIIEII